MNRFAQMVIEIRPHAYEAMSKLTALVPLVERCPKWVASYRERAATHSGHKPRRFRLKKMIIK